jgi:hypothetical protein
MAWVFTRYSSDYTSQERAAIGARLRRSPDGLVPKKTAVVSGGSNGQSRARIEAFIGLPPEQWD